MHKTHIIPGKLLISSLQLQKEKILQMENNNSTMNPGNKIQIVQTKWIRSLTFCRMSHTTNLTKPEKYIKKFQNFHLKLYIVTVKSMKPA